MSRDQIQLLAFTLELCRYLSQYTNHTSILTKGINSFRRHHLLLKSPKNVEKGLSLLWYSVLECNISGEVIVNSGSPEEGCHVGLQI